MNYEEFKEELVKRMEQRLEGTEMEVELREVLKNNDTKLEGLTVFGEGVNLSPVIYLADLYGQYQMHGDMEKIMEKVGTILGHGRKIKLESLFGTWEEAKNRIELRLLNRERNLEALKTALHRNILDLVIVPYYVVPRERDGIYFSMIDNNMLHIWGISVEDVWSAGYHNLYRERFIILNLKTFMGDEEDIQEEEPTTGMHILTNKYEPFGAIGMLRHDMLDSMGRRHGSFYILPSSLHEVMLVPASDTHNTDALRALVRTANQNVVSKSDYLSDNVYYYDAETKKLTFAE